MASNSMKCAVCQNDSDVIVSLPVVQSTLQKWSEILQTSSLLIAPRYKKICLDHFDKKWHDTLKNPTCRRSPFCIPLEYHHPSTSEQTSNAPIPADSVCDSSSVCERKKRSVSPLPEERTLHNRCKKSVDAELLIKIKDDEINDLNDKIKALKLEIASLNKRCNQKLDMQNVISLVIDECGLGDNAKAMLSLLLLNKEHRPYSKSEKELCRSIYYKKPGSYNHLRRLLDSKLPSSRTLLRWHVLKDFNVGIVKPALKYLLIKKSELSESDKELVLIVDEMDGRRHLVFDKARDMIVGFEDMCGRRSKLAKKFLSIIIRGVNGTVGNLVLANYATANGITGSFFYKYTN